MPIPSVAVNLADRAYSVHVGVGFLGDVGRELAFLFSSQKCAVISDNTVATLYASSVIGSLREAGFEPVLLAVPFGEISKSLTVAEGLLGKMAEAGLDRSSFVVALGGGVVGDLAGFVAAIYYRGIPYIQIPTTVLAQVDSSVGGKTGVNLAIGKNLVGSFHQPRAVFADIATLDSLPPREFHEGFAEIIKHAIIRDADLFRRLQDFDLTSRKGLQEIIHRNIEIKAAIVVEDEFETKGLRALLNFGHTIGHGIENAAGYGALLHGEAISLGLVAAARLSVEKAGLPASDLHAIESLLVKFQLPIKLAQEITTEAILDALARDKKFSQGQIRFVLASQIGAAHLSSEVTIPEIVRQIDSLRV